MIYTTKNLSTEKNKQMSITVESGFKLIQEIFWAHGQMSKRTDTPTKVWTDRRTIRHSILD